MYFAGELSPGIFCLGTFAWALSLGNLRLGSLAWELALGIFRLGIWAPEAGGNWAAEGTRGAGLVCRVIRH